MQQTNQRACAKPLTCEGQGMTGDRGRLSALRFRFSELVRGRLHLRQERDGDYSYWAVARTPARPLERVSSRFAITQRSEIPRP